MANISNSSAIFMGIENSSLVFRSNAQEESQLLMAISSQGMQTLPKQPHFKASLTQNVQIVHKTIIDFIADKVLFDSGHFYQPKRNLYNPETGEFTSPISGVYNLNCQVTVMNSLGPPSISEVEIMFKVGPDTYVKTDMFPSGTTHKSVSSSWFGFMKAMQKAQCMIRVVQSPFIRPFIVGIVNSEYHFSTFSGLLLN